MPTVHRIFGSTSVIGSSALLWISYYHRPYKPRERVA